ncbi:MAG: hypothetical protein ACOYOK_06025 [Pseudobdellovibrionaceae bacterium]
MTKYIALVLASVAMTAMAQTSAVTVPVPASTNTISTSVETVKAPARPWEISFFSFASSPAVQLQKGKAAVDSSNYLSVGRKISDNNKLSLRVPFAYNTSGIDKSNKERGSSTLLQDVYLVLGQSKWFQQGDWKLYGAERLYFPTSDFSKNAKTLARARVELNLERSLGTLGSLTYSVKPDYYFQSQNSYADKNATKPTNKANIQVGLDHYVELKAKANSWLVVRPLVGFLENWFKGYDNVEALHTTAFRSALTLQFVVNKSFDFALGLENRTALNGANGAPVFYQNKDNTAYLVTNVSLN